MTKVLITEDYLTNIGNSIRKENQTTTKYKPSEMANAIETNNANVATRVAAETEILNTQTNKLSSVLTALESKANGSGSGSSGTKEYVQVTFNLLANMAIFANIDPTSTLGSTTNGVLAYYGSIALTPEYVAMALGEIFVEKGSCMYFVSDTYLTGTSTVTTSGELEVITNAKNKGVVIKVNGTGSLTFS